MLLCQRRCPTASSAGFSLYHQWSTCLSRRTYTYQQSVLSRADKAIPTQAHRACRWICVQHNRGRSSMPPLMWCQQNSKALLLPRLCRTCTCKWGLSAQPRWWVCGMLFRPLLALLLLPGAAARYPHQMADIQSQQHLHCAEAIPHL